MGTAEIRFWRRDTVFCWSASSPFNIQNTGNFELVFNASLVGDKKTPRLRAKTKDLIFKLRLSFPSSFSHIIYCAKDKLCLHSEWIFLKVCGAIVFVTRWSMLCAKAKNNHISKGCSGALLKTYQPSSMQSLWAGGVWNGLPASLRFDIKTKRPPVFLPFNLVIHCEVARSYHPVQAISNSI